MIIIAAFLTFFFPRMVLGPVLAFTLTLPAKACYKIALIVV